MMTGTAFADGLQGQGQVQGINLDIEIAGDEAPETRAVDQIRYSGEYTQTLKNVPNVAAPALTTTLTETCMGSTSLGGAGAGFGFSFGTTWRDSACVRRLDAREMASFGYTLAGKERMCDDEKNREAFLRAGTPCYQDLPMAVEEPREIVPPAPVEEVPALGYAPARNNAINYLDM